MAQNTGGSVLAWLTFIVFLVLKVTHVIDWSWWLVTLPLWGFAALAVVVFAAIIGIGVWITR